jgi:hypothetical protein
MLTICCICGCTKYGHHYFRTFKFSLWRTLSSFHKKSVVEDWTSQQSTETIGNWHGIRKSLRLLLIALNGVFVENLTVAQLVLKFTAFHGSRFVITISTRNQEQAIVLHVGELASKLQNGCRCEARCVWLITWRMSNIGLRCSSVVLASYQLSDEHCLCLFCLPFARLYRKLSLWK